MEHLDERAREFARAAHRDQKYGDGSFFDWAEDASLPVEK